MQLLCSLVLLPKFTSYPKKVSCNTTQHECRHDNLVRNLGVTQCGPPLKELRHDILSHFHSLSVGKPKPNGFLMKEKTKG